MLKQMEHPRNRQIIHILNNFLLPDKKPPLLKGPQIIAVKRIHMGLPIGGQIGKLDRMFDMRAHIKVIQLLSQLANQEFQLAHKFLFFRIVKSIGLHELLLAKLEEPRFQARRVPPQSPHHRVGTGSQPIP